MTQVTDQAEAAATRMKLRALETRYEQLRGQATDDPHVRELTLRSLKRMIVQLQEELIRFQTSCGNVSP